MAIEKFTATNRQPEGNNPMTKQKPTPTDSHTIRYWDANAETYVEHQGVGVRSGAGYSAGPSYGVLYRLDDGRYLGGMRHTDRGDLMTRVRYAKTARGAMPPCWK
jgi:hypothetical protein